MVVDHQIASKSVFYASRKGRISIDFDEDGGDGIAGEDSRWRVSIAQSGEIRIGDRVVGIRDGAKVMFGDRTYTINENHGVCKEDDEEAALKIFEDDVLLAWSEQGYYGAKGCAVMDEQQFRDAVVLYLFWRTELEERVKARVFEIDGDAAKMQSEISALSAEVDITRHEAVLVSARLAPEKVLPLLINALETGTPETVRAVLVAFRLMGPEAAPALPALVKLMEKSSYRRLVCSAIGSIGPAAVSAAPEIRRYVRYKKALPAAISALGQIGASDEESIQALIRQLASPSFYRRKDAATALGHLGPAASAAVPRLKANLENVVAGRAAEAALLQIEPQAAYGRNIGESKP